MRRTMMTTGALGALLLGTAGAGAQDATTDARWQAFVGCWQPAGAAPGPAAVCVLPAGGAAVELVTVAAHAVQSRERLDASGTPVATTREQCTGTDAARWSGDARRVYLSGTQRCDGVQLSSTGLIALTRPDEWLDVRGARLAGGPPEVRVRRYVPLADASVLPADVARAADAAVATRATMQVAARANAAAPVGAAEVIDATRAVDAEVVEAWVAERGQRFALDARTLATLADAKVPGRVIDMMIAVSYPQKFAIDRNARDVAERPAVVDSSARPVATPIYGYGRGMDGRPGYCQDFRFADRYECRAYGYGNYAGYGVSPLGYGYGANPYAYGPWGWNSWGYGYGYGYGGPVIVVRPGTGGAGNGTNGRVVKGQGYTNSGSTARGTARPRGDEYGGQHSGTRTTSSSGNSSSGGSSGSSSSGGRSSSGSSGSSSGSSSSSGGGRTAHPRP